MSEGLKSEFLCDLRGDIDRSNSIHVGATPGGLRNILHIKGAVVEGPEINGVLLPSGGDWLQDRSDGTRMLDIRAAFRTDDGQLVYCHGHGIQYYEGMERATAVARRRAGEPDDPSTNYFRAVLEFETASEKYRWLNRILSVGIGRYTQTGVAIEAYRIL